MAESDITPVTPETHLIVNPDEEEVSAFFSLVLVDAGTGCHNWTGCITRFGYGQFHFNGVAEKAHRWIYAYANGPIPRGCRKQQIDHLCRNKRCVNPLHLELVSPRENTLRANGPSAINAQKTHCKRGHPFDAENTYYYKKERYCRICQRQKQQTDHARKRKKAWYDNNKVLTGRPKGSQSARSKITEDQAIEIRRMYETGNYSLAAVGALFGVSGATVSNICRRKTWKHI